LLFGINNFFHSSVA